MPHVRERAYGGGSTAVPGVRPLGFTDQRWVLPASTSAGGGGGGGGGKRPPKIINWQSRGSAWPSAAAFHERRAHRQKCDSAPGPAEDSLNHI